MYGTCIAVCSKKFVLKTHKTILNEHPTQLFNHGALLKVTCPRIFINFCNHKTNNKKKTLEIIQVINKSMIVQTNKSLVRESCIVDDFAHRAVGFQLASRFLLDLAPLCHESSSVVFHPISRDQECQEAAREQNQSERREPKSDLSSLRKIVRNYTSRVLSIKTEAVS